MTTLLSNGDRLYGPYTRTADGRAFVVLKTTEGRSHTMLWARWLLESNGVVFGPGDEVDHVDNDPLNDSLDNLQVISRQGNLRKSIALRAPAFSRLLCKECGNEFRRQTSRIAASKEGPFCSRSCSARFYARHRLPASPKFIAHGEYGKYRKGCRCMECKKANTERHTRYRLSKIAGDVSSVGRAQRS